MSRSILNRIGDRPFGYFLIAVAVCICAIALRSEGKIEVISVLAGGALALIVASRTGIFSTIDRLRVDHAREFKFAALSGALVLIVIFHTDNFALLLVSTAFIYGTVSLGLNIQFGFTGVLNFAPAAFFGVGAYTAAFLTKIFPEFGIVILVAGGACSVAIGSLLLLPVLRTSGHYAAVITIAFGILFKNFLEVSDWFGGPQGLAVGSLSLFGFDLNQPVVLFGSQAAFLFNYAIVALLLMSIVFELTDRLDHSWIGLNLDNVRLDEVSASSYGISLVRWKIFAFTSGNFVIGLAGALYGMMLGFVAPTGFTFADSLVMVSIIILGGIGSLWGGMLAAFFLIVIPEKLQGIQEYRLLLFSLLVILVLLFKPAGFIARPRRQLQ